MAPVSWDDAIWYGDELELRHFGGFDMIGTAMTILMAAYSGDGTDVAIISDRRSAPNAIGLASGICTKESAYKTLRLGPQIAIGFGGTVPLSNIVLARFLGCAAPRIDEDLLSGLVEEEDLFNYCFDDVVSYLNEAAGTAMTEVELPPGVQASAMLVGVFADRPILAEWNALTEWKVKPVLSGTPWCKPKDMPSDPDVGQFETYVTRPGLDYIARLKAAVEFCANRYCSVNHRYVLRRLQTGFVREEGVLPSSSPAQG